MHTGAYTSCRTVQGTNVFQLQMHVERIGTELNYDIVIVLRTWPCAGLQCITRTVQSALQSVCIGLQTAVPAKHQSLLCDCALY